MLTVLTPNAGSEDSNGPAEDGPVLRHVGLCPQDPGQGRGGCLLQRLCPQYAGDHPLCRHRSGSLRGEVPGASRGDGALESSPSPLVALISLPTGPVGMGKTGNSTLSVYTRASCYSLPLSHLEVVRGGGTGKCIWCGASDGVASGAHPPPSPLDAQEHLAAALCGEQRRPWCVRASGLWHHLQHLWPAGQLPTGPGQDPDAGAR